ncbi:MMPL family transporter, partial [Mycobacterium tuberculosis]
MRSQRLAGHLSAAARTIHALSLPIILFWVALTIVVNVVAPQLQSVARTHSVALGPHDAPSLIAMKRIGKDFQQFDSDTTAMVLLEGQEKLGDEAHRFYDVLVTKLSQDTTHVQHIENFWGDPLTAAGSQSADGKAAYVQLNLTGDQGGEPPRHVRRLQFLERMGSCQVVHRGGTRRSCVSGRCGWSQRSA